ncbi:hypothetical protein Cob_v006068 [Colletotrichum orbiculare MAFF 240422]|uniref:Uncharacterized protein n=1 Tax=Colletotrichum orbiculare (strain 104-T / ATCC 96160 / CBS 514.97 / LARS 414 / MAFF 240422) TaxID=1213857 RepID=A0A484FVL8_COLOR|nr:hypothetical protein Cob_v006068 [Colletotrichum orbiculare MAFF 240422]
MYIHGLEGWSAGENERRRYKTQADVCCPLGKCSANGRRLQANPGGRWVGCFLDSIPQPGIVGKRHIGYHHNLARC